MKIFSILIPIIFFSSCSFGKPIDIEPSLINGRPAKPGEFPASVYVDTGGGRCTGTVVGPQVLIFAAHCVRSGGTIRFSVGANPYTGVCTHAKEYATNNTADYTLCKLDQVVRGIEYENILTDDKVLKVGAEILNTGYGCTQPGGTGGNDGVYRVGESRVQRLPSGTNNDIVTSGGGALCFGDSGGPAFYYLDKEKTKRVQISVNSRGDIATTSYLSALFTPQAKRFITAWQQLNPGLKICGVDADTQNCRATDAPVPPPPPSDKCSEEAKSFLAAKPAYDASLSAVLSCLIK